MERTSDVGEGILAVPVHYVLESMRGGESSWFSLPTRVCLIRPGRDKDTLIVEKHDGSSHVMRATHRGLADDTVDKPGYALERYMDCLSNYVSLGKAQAMFARHTAEKVAEHQAAVARLLENQSRLESVAFVSDWRQGQDISRGDHPATYPAGATMVNSAEIHRRNPKKPFWQWSGPDIDAAAGAQGCVVVASSGKGNEERILVEDRDGSRRWLWHYEVKKDGGWCSLEELKEAVERMRAQCIADLVKKRAQIDATLTAING